jgi:hypothetical protein
MSTANNHLFSYTPKTNVLYERRRRGKHDPKGSLALSLSLSLSLFLFRALSFEPLLPAAISDFADRFLLLLFLRVDNYPL